MVVSGQAIHPPTRGHHMLHGRLALFAEVVATGVMVLVGSLLLVTMPAALAAGVAHLRRHVHGLPTSVRRFSREWLRAITTTLPLGFALVLAAALLVLNLDIAGTGALPGADLVRGVSVIVLALAVAVTARAAGAWSDAEGIVRQLGVSTLGRAAWHRVTTDPSGSVLVVVATAAAILLPVLVPPLAVVVGGLVCMAIVAVDVRASGRPPR